MLVVILCVGVAAGLALTPLVIRGAIARGLYDLPDGGRRIHPGPVPRVGGVAVCAGMLGTLSVAVWLQPSLALADPAFYLGLLVAGSLFFGAGLVDDLQGLSPTAKGVAQAAGALVLFGCGFRIDATFLGSAAGWLSLPLTVLWVVAVSNAINLIDGLDGLATGIAMVAAASTLVVSFLMGDGLVAPVAAALFGVLLGFLRYNFSPARIFLGDSGSLFIGGMLAALSLRSQTGEPLANLGLVPLFALALPLLDTGLAVLRRWLRGVSFSTADRRHIHHQLLARGLSRAGVVVALYAVSAALALAGAYIAVWRAGTFGALVAGGAVGALLLAGVAYLRYHEFGEALKVVVRAPAALRRVIQDQINARDVAQAVAGVRALGELNAFLQANAGRFGFLAMEVGRGTERGPLRLVAGQWDGRHARFDHPLLTPGSADSGLVLRIWCPARDGFRPFGAERVAGILAPALEEWLSLWYSEDQRGDELDPALERGRTA